MVKKRGIVWNYFTKKVHGSQITAFCKFCDQSYIQNATRMEKHIERCVKCPEDIKRHFMNAVRNKRAKTMLTMKLAENWSIQPPRTVQNDMCNENLTEWEYRDEFNNEIPDNVTNSSDITDSKSWNRNTQVETEQSEETVTNRDWNTIDRNRESETVIADEIQESHEESPNTRKSHPNRRFSQLPLLSGRTSVNSILQNKIQQEQYLERRALRRIAELELQRKTLELEKYQWDVEKEKAQSEVRWAHECRMMQLKEEEQRELFEQNRTKTIAMQSNQM